MTLPLPIDTLLPELCAALNRHTSLVLQAAPGAGKTTRVPLALLAESWLQGRKIVMLEPRRLAARAAARYMAARLGEKVGATVGYRVRLDSRIGPNTRIEIVTDGVLLRYLQDDPALSQIGAVIFDEFHERSLESDLALALCRDSQSGLREDLRLLIMSATFDADYLSEKLGGVPVLKSEGRIFPVETRYVPATLSRRLADSIVDTIQEALRQSDGGILVFVPGIGEIRQVLRRLEAETLPPNLIVAPLFGDLRAEDQDRAIQPPPAGFRKLVLATAIAETSLTIEDVRIVIDSGLARLPTFDTESGMGRLVTQRVSRDSADQRRGRAGRVAPGICYRLWGEAEDRALLSRRPAEILTSDLADLALQLACWGTIPDQLYWIDPPPAAPFAQAQNLLKLLGVVDVDGRITPHGRTIGSLGLHPRLAHMLIYGREKGAGATAAFLAALLQERDILRPAAGSGIQSVDLRERLETGRGASLDHSALSRVHELAASYRTRLDIPTDALDRTAVGWLVATAYPDRLAALRGVGQKGYRLAMGRGADLPAHDALGASPYLAVADLDGARDGARIFRAAPITLAEIEQHFALSIETTRAVAWDSRSESIVAEERRHIGAVILSRRPLTDIDPGKAEVLLLDAIRAADLKCLPWTVEAENLQARITLLRRTEGETWPDFSTPTLLATLAIWLAPHLDGMRRLRDLDRLSLHDILMTQLDWQQSRQLMELAPTHWQVPSGSHIPIDYQTEGGPALAVRLQELFGLAETPAILRGRVPLLLKLLSPASRPVQMTRDLAGFWKTSYRVVKAELKGRYPRHPWPDDPLAAAPTRRAKPRASERR